jgi:hypothetical protein
LGHIFRKPQLERYVVGSQGFTQLILSVPRIEIGCLRGAAKLAGIVVGCFISYFSEIGAMAGIAAHL